MASIIKGIVKHRYDTAANLTSDNPIMLAGEIGIESDTGRFKIGDGSTSWTSIKYAVIEVLNITADTILSSREGQQYLVKNSDTSAHTISYGANSMTIQPDYTGLFFYSNSAWVCCGAWNVDGDFIAGGNIAAIGTISGAISTPAIYDFYDHEPQTVAPATKFSGTSWINVSERALFYHLANTSGGAETDVVIRDLVEHNNGSGTWAIDKEYAYADLVYDDVIGGSGTYAGKYIIGVDNYSGMFSRYEGGYAETFENGIQNNAVQNFRVPDLTGLGDPDLSTRSADYVRYSVTYTVNSSVTLGGDGATVGTASIPYANTGTLSTDENQTVVDNYTIKKWRRIS